MLMPVNILNIVKMQNMGLSESSIKTKITAITHLKKTRRMNINFIGFEYLNVI